MYGVVLIAVLAVAGGVIAFVGDRLGTKIGKKRLSLFGLRPRHTSMLVTIFTGVCITVLTFGVMAAVSENVRTALFGMEQLNRNMSETKANLQKATKELSDAEREKQQTVAALDKSKKEMAKLKEEQKALEEEAEHLKEGNRILEKEKNDLLAQTGELLEKNDALLASNNELLAQNSALAEQNSALSSANGELAQNNAELSQRAKNLRDGLVAVREGSIVYRAGEIIAEGVIEGNRGEDEVAKDIAALVAKADADVASRTGQPAGKGGDLWIYQPEYDAAIDKIAKNQGNTVVRITAAGNLVKGEPVHTALELYEDKLVYKEDELIVSKTYNINDLADGEAENLVMNFLKEVNAAAAEKGVLKDPIRGSVGVMDGMQFYDVADAIKPLKGVVVLSAFAREDTDAAGPLRLSIKVEQEDR